LKYKSFNLKVMKSVVKLIYVCMIGGTIIFQSCKKENPIPNVLVNEIDSTNIDSTNWGGGNSGGGSTGGDTTNWGGGNTGGGSTGGDTTNWGGGNPIDSTNVGG
jgi:hypothetical protein